jgi:enoyl-CoA hydratase
MRDEAVVQWSREGAVEICTIDRPKALNALNSAVIEALMTGLQDRAGDDSLRAVILTGSGEKAFVAGADISQMQGLSAIEAEAFSAKGQALGDLMQAFPVPIIAAVNGFALGGGCELAMSCDIIIAGSTAKFGQPEVKLGLVPGFGGTQRLVRRVGLTVALDLVLTGRIVDGKEAVAIGLAARSVEGCALEAAKGVAKTLSRMAPQAIRLAKRLMHDNADANLSVGLAAERTAFGLCFATEDQSEGMAAFLGKRHAQFTGR